MVCHPQSRYHLVVIVKIGFFKVSIKKRQVKIIAYLYIAVPMMNMPSVQKSIPSAG